MLLALEMEKGVHEPRNWVESLEAGEVKGWTPIGHSPVVLF